MILFLVPDISDLTLFIVAFLVYDRLSSLSGARRWLQRQSVDGKAFTWLSWCTMQPLLSNVIWDRSGCAYNGSRDAVFHRSNGVRLPRPVFTLLYVSI